jgi:hypothetical protein
VRSKKYFLEKKTKKDKKIVPPAVTLLAPETAPGRATARGETRVMNRGAAATRECYNNEHKNRKYGELFGLFCPVLVSKRERFVKRGKREEAEESA